MSDEPKHDDDDVTPDEQPAVEPDEAHDDLDDETKDIPTDDEAPEPDADSPSTDNEQAEEDAEADGDSPDAEPEPSEEGEDGDDADAAEEDDDDDTKDVPESSAAEGDEDEDTDGEAPAIATGEGEDGAEEGEDEEPEEEPPPEPTPLYDGLDSGLAWFGAEPFVPPVPTGYVAREADEAPAAPLGRAALADRKLSVRERLEARRAETDATKKWYQRVPIPIWLCMPAMIFIVVWIGLFAFRGIPGPSEAMDDALLTAGQVEEAKISEALVALGVASMDVPDAFQPLPGKMLRMDKMRSANVTFTAPEGKPLREFSCEVAIVEWHAGSEYGVVVELDPHRGVALLGNQYPKVLRGGKEAERVDFYSAFWPQTGKAVRVREETALKLKWWYRLRVAVDGNLTSSYINGKHVGEPAGTSGRQFTGVTLKVANARVIVRNIVLKPPPPAAPAALVGRPTVMLPIGDMALPIGNMP